MNKLFKLFLLAFVVLTTMNINPITVAQAEDAGCNLSNETKESDYLLVSKSPSPQVKESAGVDRILMLISIALMLNVMLVTYLDFPKGATNAVAFSTAMTLVTTTISFTIAATVTSSIVCCVAAIVALAVLWVVSLRERNLKLRYMFARIHIYTTLVALYLA